MRKNKQVFNIAVTGVLTALVFVTVTFVRFPVPTGIVQGGLVHLGNAPMFIAAIVFGKKQGAFAGGVGMSLFNILVAPGPHWAPFTLLTRGAMGYAVGAIAEKRQGKSYKLNLFAIAISAIIFIIGMYVSEIILLFFGFGGMQPPEDMFLALVPLGSIPGNIIQVVASAAVTLPLVSKLRRYRERYLYNDE